MLNSEIAWFGTCPLWTEDGVMYVVNKILYTKSSDLSASKDIPNKQPLLYYESDKPTDKHITKFYQLRSSSFCQTCSILSSPCSISIRMTLTETNKRQQWKMSFVFRNVSAHYLSADLSTDMATAELIHQITLYLSREGRLSYLNDGGF